MSTEIQTFAQGLRAGRKKLGITQSQLAELLDVSFEAISKWERELSIPSVITQEGALARIIEILHFQKAQSDKKRAVESV